MVYIGFLHVVVDRDISAADNADLSIEILAFKDQISRSSVHLPAHGLQCCISVQSAQWHVCLNSYVCRMHAEVPLTSVG